MQSLIIYALSALSCAIFGIVNGAASLSLVSSSIFATLGNPTLLCVLGSRMFFNLMEAAEHGVNIDTDWSSHSHGVFHIKQARDEK